MKQEEKTRRTRARILEAAIEEFGSKTYDGGSINNICSQYGISKGLLYHNYPSKDQLYLECVKDCYRQLAEHLHNQHMEAVDAGGRIRESMAQRQHFFLENPNCGQLYFSSLLQPPAHLQEQLRQIRGGFRSQCEGSLRRLVQSLQLRPEISPDTAVAYFLCAEELFNGYFQRVAGESPDFPALMADHDRQLSAMLDVLLYGIAQK